jgi:hypothetical protein
VNAKRDKEEGRMKRGRREFPLAFAMLSKFMSVLAILCT